MLAVNFRSAYSVSRALGAPPSAKCGAVRKLNGEVTTTTLEANSRWEEHYASVYRGNILDEYPPGVGIGDISSPSSPFRPSQLDVGPKATWTLLRSWVATRGLAQIVYLANYCVLVAGSLL